MKILISVAAWGDAYTDAFANYSLASQLAPGNIAKCAQDHQITYQIITTRADAERLRSHVAINALEGLCDVVWDHIEDYGYHAGRIPNGEATAKYTFLSKMQNTAIRRSLAFDVLVFNYADFIWADGSLTNAVTLMRDGIDGVLAFALPVDARSATKSLEAYRDGDARSAINIPPRAAAALAVDCLHREARLRFWNGPKFSERPTYLLWPVADEGLIVRAYHQTVLTLRVRQNDPEYLRGIDRGTLDGFFSARLVEKGSFLCASDSDEIFAFSLHDAEINTALRCDQNREEALRAYLENGISAAQRHLAAIPISVRTREPHPQIWRQIAEDSWRAIEPIHRTTTTDQSAFEAANAEVEGISRAEIGWRSGVSPGGLAYFYLLIPLANGPVGRALKRILGKNRIRSVRLMLERRLSGRNQPQRQK